MSFKTRLSSLHYQPGKSLSPWLWPLVPLSWFYGLAIAIRHQAVRMGVLETAKSPVPVISIGNLTTGGTGKTPIVIEVARGLIQAGKTVVILSRGYGAAEPVAYARALDPKHGDEAYLIQAQVPEAIVIVGRDRVHTLNRALEDYRPDFVLLDDGFQYLRLQRHLNILLIDGSLLFGNKHLLPAGPLREPLSALSRADLILVTKQVDQAAMQAVESWVAAHCKKPRPTVLPVPFQASGLKPLQFTQNRMLLESLKGRSIVAFSGIAQPERFEQDLKQLGAQLIKHFRFSDHHVYTADDIARLIAVMENNREKQPLLITTEKDLIKVATLIPTAWQPFVYTLQMRPALDGHWFYSEFLTQMLAKERAGAVHVN